MGIPCENGEGVLKDTAEAMRWYRLAAEQGDAEAQVRLARIFFYGEIVEKDIAEAVRLFRLAAEQGDAYAQYRLGWMYDNGTGVLKDKSTAHMWLNISSANGHEDAGEARDNAELNMTREQISEAARRARICMASSYTECD